MAAVMTSAAAHAQRIDMASSFDGPPLYDARAGLDDPDVIRIGR
jgi:hypothetical protein